ncbi:methionine ABC transporter permease [Neomicrococcus aestuarii]|uniref:D-methionine transport system permease protein n=1 Tax=Neomicrococcus aestuarii TaxID=556325 RepID=A0A1L2ZPI6_9MICC|nr:methionine ABC transporter permease [Neomicrococcus aestuarii]APF40938.1 methionine ABC transporter ATP-binding protein [Neomicrococcus aestuarii]MBB5512731.1 D-methionine transport system permease protein [Neomicrococcus aestuarii]
MIDWETMGPLLTQSLQQTLTMVVITMLLGGFFGLIIGILLYATRPGNILQNAVVFNVLNFIINVVRPIPFIIFISLVGPFSLSLIGTSIGTEAAIVPMTLMASVVIGRIVEQNLVGVDPGVVEAARAMGSSRARVLFDVVLRESIGPLILGYTFVFIGVVDMSAVAGYIGGGGLGDMAITYGYQQFNYAVTILAVVVIVLLVQLAQLIGNWLARKALHR